MNCLDYDTWKEKMMLSNVLLFDWQNFILLFYITNNFRKKDILYLIYYQSISVVFHWEST